MASKDIDPTAIQGELPLSAIDRMIAKALGEDVPFGCADDPLASACPQLWRCLTLTEAGKTHIMAPARMTLNMTIGGVIVGLSSSALAFSMETSCGHVHEAMEALEKALCSPNPPLRPWDGKETRLRKRREKA